MMREREGRCESCDKRDVRLTYVAVGEWKGKRLCEECLVTCDALKRPTWAGRLAAEVILRD